MTLKFEFEPLEVLLDDGVEQLVEQHWGEIALDKADVPLAIDWTAMLADELNGTFKVFTARDGARLVGYVSCHLFYPARYTATLYVNDDVLWLHPDYRKGLAGYRMLAAFLRAIPKPCKVQMKEKLTFKEGRVGKIFERLGLTAVETVYSAYLSE